MKMLEKAREMGANLLLNTGPLPDGSIHPEDVKTLREVGGWETAAIKFHNSVDTVINGRELTQPIAGPLTDLKQGVNTIVWSFKKHEP